MSLAAPTFQATRLAHLFSDVSQGHKVLWRSIIAMTIGLLVCMLFMNVDHRLLNGVDVWDKPAKFFLSLIVQMATVSWALMRVPEIFRKTRGINIAVWVMTFWAWAELAYLVFRAARGEASHFNQTTPFAAVAYAIMGSGAVSIAASAFFVGWRVCQARKLGLWTEAAGLGLLIGMVLGTVAGGYMGGQHSHWVGGELSDAHGLGFFGWSMTGGDLRVAHFLGLHTAQIIPFAALSGRRSVVYGVGLACGVLTAALFVLAISGRPILIG